MAPPVNPDTRETLLDAAEVVFAEHGFARASIRRIVALAGANLAAVHYHFGSKQALIEAVFDRRLRSVNARRLELLSAVETAAAGDSPDLRALLEAFLSPMLELAERARRDGGNPLRLYGRLITEPSDLLRRIMERQFGGIVRRFITAFQRALPAVGEAELLWRLFFVIGAAAHTMTDPPGLKRLSGGRCDPDDTAAVLQQLLAFAVAGMQAVPDANRKGKAR